MKKRIEITVELEARTSEAVGEMIKTLENAMFAWKHWHDAKGKGKRKTVFIMKDVEIKKGKEIHEKDKKDSRKIV